MAWVKIPPEHHEIFMAAVPKDPRVTTLKMFGGIAAKANGQMFAGLFARSFIVKLSEPDHAEAMKLDGAEQFDPMGNGRVMTNTVLMPEDAFGDDAELRSWLRRALDYTLTLPPKAVTPKDKPTSAKTAPTKSAPAKAAAKAAAAKATAKDQPTSAKTATAKAATARAAAKASPAKATPVKATAAKAAPAKPAPAKPAPVKSAPAKSAVKKTAAKPAAKKR